MENTYTVNDNTTLQYPYAAKDGEGKLYLVLGPSTMLANVIRVQDDSLVPENMNSTQVKSLTVVPQGVTITMKVIPKYE